jgi:hypothetical protein
LENWIRTLDRFGKQGLALLASLLITLPRSGRDRFDKALIMAKFFKQAVFGHKQTLNARKVVIGRLLQFVSWMRYAAGHRRNDKRGYLLVATSWYRETTGKTSSTRRSTTRFVALVTTGNEELTLILVYNRQGG